MKWVARSVEYDLFFMETIPYKRDWMQGRRTVLS
jgi:hypothetical protein